MRACVLCCVYVRACVCVCTAYPPSKYFIVKKVIFFLKFISTSAEGLYK